MSEDKTHRQKQDVKGEGRNMLTMYSVSLQSIIMRLARLELLIKLERKPRKKKIFFSE